MKVFKFGGASLKSPEAIRNMAEIVRSFKGENLVVVVSAMGKTTNNLEALFNLVEQQSDPEKKFKEIVSYHLEISHQLIRRPENLEQIDRLVDQLGTIIRRADTNDNPDKTYDQIISFGELFSSTLIAAYLSEVGLPTIWKDAREFIKTDFTYREGRIEWAETCARILDHLKGSVQDHRVVTQGFIGSTEIGDTTTLGREGSDFTAAIIASCLDAESVTIWKDVPGILNADPKRFPDPKLYDHLSYQEAAEMTYYGASVIHPKTIKPLANKNIPLHVKSFEKPDLPGTLIDQGGPHPRYPTYVVKDEQCLISFMAKDLAFINERNLSIIFHMLDMLNIKINMMQNSAVSLTICVDNRSTKIKKLTDALKNDFSIRFNEHLRLITVKNYSPASVIQVSKGKSKVAAPLPPPFT